MYQANGSQNYNQNSQHHNQNYRHNKGKGIAANSVSLSYDPNTGQEREDTRHVDNQTIQTLLSPKNSTDKLLSCYNSFRQVRVQKRVPEMQMTSGAVNFAGPFSEEASGDW